MSTSRKKGARLAIGLTRTKSTRRQCPLLTADEAHIQRLDACIRLCRLARKGTMLCGIVLLLPANLTTFALTVLGLLTLYVCICMTMVSCEMSFDRAVKMRRITDIAAGRSEGIHGR